MDDDILGLEDVTASEAFKIIYELSKASKIDADRSDAAKAQFTLLHSTLLQALQVRSCCDVVVRCLCICMDAGWLRGKPRHAGNPCPQAERDLLDQAKALKRQKEVRCQEGVEVRE